MSSVATEAHVGRRLYDAGFRQGAILRPSGLRFVYNEPTPVGEGVEAKERAVKAKERLVVASQDCDILAKPDKEPYVELLIYSGATPSKSVHTAIF